MNERHERQLKIAHQLYDNRDLKQELMWQREFLDTGYLSYQQVCFNKWIFDECLKRLEERKIGKWIEERDDYGNITAWHCSNCYDETGFVTTCAWDYCPSCGSRNER